MTQSGDHSEDDIALVGEYALHLLDENERASFEKRLAMEPGLQALLREWDEGLIRMTDEVRQVLPPERLKSAITKKLFPQEEVPGKSIFERFALIFAATAVIVLGLFFAPDVLNRQSGPVYLAEIVAGDRSLVVSARFDPDTAIVDLDRLEGAALPGRALELWLIADGAEAPVSLGVMPEAQLATIKVPEILRAGMIGGTLAISDEPEGGSPTGAPTGAVLAVGSVISS